MLAVAAVGVTTTALGVVGRPVADDLGVGAVALGWAVNAYLLVAASLALVGGRLGDRFGRRRAFGAGCALFAVGSAVAALAPGVAVLILGRVLQGLGAAVLLPSSIEVIAAERRGVDEHRALLVRGTTFSVAFGIGPLVGGLVGDTLGWRWLFVLVGALAVMPAVVALAGRGGPEPEGEALRDVPGAVLSVIGVLGVVLLAERSRTWGSSWWGLAAAALGAIVLVAFVALERRSPAPLLHPSLLRDRVVAGGDLATFASSLGMLGLLYFFGIYATSAAALELSGLEVALALVPFAASLALLGWFAGYLVRRLGRAVPVVLGLGLMAAGFLVLSRTTAGADDAALLVPLAVCGVGAGLANACVTGPAVLWVRQLRVGEAAGVASLARFSGTALAVAMGTATYLGVGTHHVVASGAAPAPAAEVAAAGGSPGVGADELVLGGNAFERALAGLDHDLREPFRRAVQLDTVDGFSATMRWTGVTVAVAAVVSGWLLRRGRQPRQSSSGVRSRGPLKGNGTAAPEPAEA